MCCFSLKEAGNFEYRKIRLLIGVCDIGNGHINRQRCIINELLKCNVEIVIAAPMRSMAYFNTLYPQIKKAIVNIPWIYCNNGGIDFTKTLLRYKENKVDQCEKFFEFALEIQSLFNGEMPDIIMSDYEPNTAQLSYALNKPLIGIEQQSKFLYIDSDKVNGLSISEEISRLNYFFPKVAHRYISSFFPLEKIEEDEITLLPPFLDTINMKRPVENKGIIYFSPYSDDYAQFIKILEIAKKQNHILFHVYTNLTFNNYVGIDNIVFKKISDEFKNDLAECEFVISSSGHQLISEAINLLVPLFVFTFNTFEQNYNAKMVEKYKLGSRIKDFNEFEFKCFLANIEYYRSNMLNFKDKYWRSNWKNIFMASLDSKFGIHYIGHE